MKHLNLPKEGTFTGPALIWKRIAAFFIDMALINLVVFFPFRSLVQNMLPKNYSFSDAYAVLNTGFGHSVSWAMSILVILYFLLMERKMQQTIGKMLMKIYVTGDNEELKTWQILVRNIVFLPVFPFVLLWILDPLFMFFTKTNQRLTEILSRTKVVERYTFEQ